MMRKVAILLCSLLLSVVSADYINPPGWESETDFTHQSWDFATNRSSSLPAAPDGNPAWQNSFGTPGLVAIDYSNPMMSTWMDEPMGMPGCSRQGVYGGMGDTTLTFFVPNDAMPEPWKKQIWVQMTYYSANIDYVGFDIQLSDTFNIEIARDENFTDTSGISVISETVTALDEPAASSGKGRWYRFTGLYEFSDQPAQEYIRLTDFNLDNPVSTIDEVDIDTRCIPEPMTLMLLAAGGMYVIRKKRK